MIFQGIKHGGHRRERILLIGYYDRFGISTVIETLEAIQRFSAYPVTVLNLHEHRYGDGYLRLHPSIRLEFFDAIVLHNSVAYDVDNLRSLDRELAVTLREFEGAKILLKQDENHCAREMAAYIGETGFDTVYSCLPSEEVPKVYPAAVVGKVKVVRMLTGYVTPALRGEWELGGERPIDIGYRGSIQPLSFGRLAYEKRKIGYDVARLLRGSELRVDISSRWEDRFGGKAWFKFLHSCKATLGVESGASIFDLEGQLDTVCAAARQALGPERDDEAYIEAYLEFLEPLEGAVHYNQISPRHFEAAATGTVQLMYPGRYSDIFVAGRHYFPLARDCSNLSEALDLVRDPAAREDMARRAYEEIILDKRYWIESFVAGLDSEIEAALESKGRRLRPPRRVSSEARNVLLMCAHEPVIDPRIGWIARHAPAGIVIHQLGTVAHSLPPSVEPTEWGGSIIRVPKQFPSAESFREWYSAVEGSTAGMAGLSELKFMQDALALDDFELAALIGSSPGSERLAQFRWYLKHVLQVSNSLIEAVRATRGIVALITTDLDTLPAAAVIKGMLGVPLIYDSHEYWPESDVLGAEFETQFWLQLESRMVRVADRCQTVSDSLADLMTERYGVRFFSVPNAESLAAASGVECHPPADEGTVKFLFLGNFAPRRGIELLIDAWVETNPEAVLLLQGPDNEFKDGIVARARATGMEGTRILFPPAVPEAELVATAAAADVGLIPYTPSGVGYQNCCPNKLSQYMAAGIAILANSTDFVKRVVTESRSGLCVDFSNKGALVSAVNSMIKDPALRAHWGKAAREYFLSRFHWEACAASMYESLRAYTASAPALPFEVYTDSLAPEQPVRAIYAIRGTAALAAADSAIENAMQDDLPKTTQLDSRHQASPVPPPPCHAMATPDPGRAASMAAVLLLRIGSAAWRILPASIRARLMPRAARVVESLRNARTGGGEGRGNRGG